MDYFTNDFGPETGLVFIYIKKKQTNSAGQFEFHFLSCVQDTSSPTRPKSTADLFIVLVLQTASNLQSKETRTSTGMANFQNLQRVWDFFPPLKQKPCRPERRMPSTKHNTPPQRSEMFACTVTPRRKMSFVIGATQTAAL